MSEEFLEGLPAQDAAESREEPSGHFIEQAGVICLRQRKGKPEVLLIRGRRYGKWGIPKGSIEPGESSSQAAAREAFEEAGVSGRCEETALATFEYHKTGKTVPCRVSVHLMDVESIADEFPEKDERRPRWIDCEAAVAMVGDQGLGKILHSIAG